MFNERKEEYSTKQGKNIPVWITPKYEESKAKAIEIINSKQFGIEESDFWILMNETKSGKMAYTGLIISHNGCLKINDALEPAKKFKPECVSFDKDGYSGSLVFMYCCPEQGLYEVGEVNPKNCKIDYPYAMAFKRMMDRVVLKNSKLAFAGIYSEEEADEFRNKYDEPTDKKDKPKAAKPKETKEPEEADEPKESGSLRADPYYCTSCGLEIEAVKGKDGSTISPINLRDLSYARYGKVLCATCMKLYDKAKKRDEEQAS